MLKVETSRSGSLSRLSSSSDSQRRLFDNDDSRPLAGVVVCLTGLTAETKSQLHNQVKELGGTYSRDLVTSETTHLIVLEPKGAKYQTAVSCRHIHIVSPAWLQVCANRKTRADEAAYRLNDASKPKQQPPETNANASLLTQMEESLSEQENSDLSVRVFSSCCLFLLGFEKESEVPIKLSRLIRLGWGTIYWKMNESITHIIVNDDCQDEYRDMARNMSLHHPNGPALVSPWWVVSSLRERSLQSPLDYRPEEYRVKQPLVKKATSPKTKTKAKKRINSRLFRGSLFSIMRLTPPEGTVDFDLKEMEQLILSHGGQILSSIWLEAVKTDNKKESKKRNCYVVTWGGYTTSSHITVHPFLSQIKRYDLCSIKLVTPIWLQACVKDDKEIVVPTQYPLLFEPQPWPMQNVKHLDKSNKKVETARCIRACVTGFVGHERTGIIYLLDAVGAVYTESMKATNTHLICKVGKGPKYEKALEWGLHVVSVEWLHHVVQHGYNGERKESDQKMSGGGCESMFAVTDKTRTKRESGDQSPPGKRQRKSHPPGNRRDSSGCGAI